MLTLNSSNFMRSFFFSLGLSMLLTTLLVEMARDFDQALTEAEISHVYEEHNGGHSAFLSRAYVALPFLADVLSWEKVTSIAAVHPQGKVVATWASLKVSVR